MGTMLSKSVAESETAIALDTHWGHRNAERSSFDKRAVCSPESTASIAFRASSKVDVEAGQKFPIRTKSLDA